MILNLVGWIDNDMSNFWTALQAMQRNLQATY